MSVDFLDISLNESVFEDIKHLTYDSMEYWYGRDLQQVLEYKEWRNFTNVIEKAKAACKNSGIDVGDHFVEATKIVRLAKSAQRQVDDVQLSRYACYLIVQNGDPNKEVIALGQTYFAVKARQQELTRELGKLEEQQKCLALRNEIIKNYRSLAEAARMAGIDHPLDYALFLNCGYQGLYGGLGAPEIQQRKGLDRSQQIIDHMGSAELAANLFLATQTDEKLRREHIRDREEANETHYEVGERVRQTIIELGGVLPENLPAY